MNTPRINSQWYYVPNIFDRCQNNTKDLAVNTLLEVIQPYGCPKNGTMGMVYVQDAKTKEFIGLVCIASLTKTPQMVRMVCKNTLNFNK